MLPSSFPDADIDVLATQTSGTSGSDLKEMCRDAAMQPLREYMRERGGCHEEVVKGVQEVYFFLRYDDFRCTDVWLRVLKFGHWH